MSEDKVYIPELVNDGGPFNKEKDRSGAKLRIGCAAISLSYLLVMAVGLGIYIWTLVIAYQSLGIVGAVLSAVLPFFAQIFWCIKFWSDTGTIFNLYCIVVISYTVITMVMRTGSKIFFFGCRR